MSRHAAGAPAPAMAERGIRARVRWHVPGFQLDIALDAADEVLVLFGPSGAGKTSVLNIIAGLVRPDAGEIVIDGRTVLRRGLPGPVVDVPARRRGVGFVMQSYALFPHMTALENVMYPLGRAPDRFERARALLELVSIVEHADRRPVHLSGGQQQRVALARALASPRRILLLDEPFAALDGAMRERLQEDLRRLRDELSLTVLLVTHRLEDAFAIGDRIAVLRNGRIEQAGPVGDVFRRPATRGVAESMGIRNLLHARIVPGVDGHRLEWEGIVLEFAHPDPPPPGTQVTAYIRPDDVKVVYPDRPLSPAVARNVLVGRITAARESAGVRVLIVRLSNGRELEVRFPLLSYSSLRLEPGSAIRVALRREGIVLLRE